ncbi:MAG: 30S ribosomal protein S16 [Opitutales bacterium]
MALKIRLQRGGTTHRPRYRVVVAEASARRDGRFVEIVGQYNPQARGQELELNLKLDRIDYWASVGAKPTDTARTLINRYRRENPAVEAAAETAAEATAE